jgi:hypothetical protein
MKPSRIIIVVGVLIAAPAAVAVVLVPRWIKARIIAAAAMHGVALSIDDLSIAPSRTRLKGVRATPLIQGDPSLRDGGDKRTPPKIAASAATVDVELDGLTPTGITVSGMNVELDGAAADVRDAIAARDRSTGGGASTLTHVTVSDSTFTWRHAFSTNLVSINATHVSGDMTRKPGRALGDDWHVETSELRAFDVPSKTSAWALSADGDVAGTRGTLTLAKGATVKVDVGANASWKLDVDTPNVSATDLGIPSALLGMYGDESSRFEIHLHHRRGAEQTDGTLVATASNVFIGASTARTSLAVDGRYSGGGPTGSEPLQLLGATLRAGPFTGALQGGFGVHDGAITASVHYASGVMSCLDAIKSQAASYGDLGKGVAALAGILGLDRAVEGRVMLKGDVEIDTRTNTNRFAFRTEGDCKLSYLPTP